MANSVTIRTTAPGAKEAASDLDKVKASASGLGITAKSAFGAVGVAAAGGFAYATKGALEAQDAQGKFMAATGQSRDAAKQFVSGMDSLAGSAGAVGLSFDQIATTGDMVAQQFGTTGQKTVDLTGNILEFSKVTKQDATGAAKGLDDTLAAYGLSADDASGFMDKLVASNQKFGTDVGPQALGVLQNMAPAIQTLGGNADDAVGFLNLMETAGIDAGSAVRGLNKAAATAPNGSTMQGIYTHLASIKDQGDRTKEAVKLFGTQAGVKLAEAIKPGETSLTDFEISTADAKDATKKAADAMETDSEKIQGAFQKLTAGAREVGQDFGPALTGLASLGSLAAPLLSGGKDLLAKIGPGLIGAATATGAAEGVAQAEGATGPGAIAAFLQKFGLMTPAKVAAAVAAGEAEGTAEGEAAAESMASKSALSSAASAGTALGVAAAGAAAIWFASRGINDIFAGPGSESGYRNAATTVVDQFSSGLAENLRGPFKDKVMAAYEEGIKAGLDPQAALKQAELVGQQFLAGSSQSGSVMGDFALAGHNWAAAAGSSFGSSPVWGSMGGDIVKAFHDSLPADFIAHTISEHQDEADAAAQKIADQQSKTYEDTIKGNRNSWDLWLITRDTQEAASKHMEDLWNKSALAVSNDLVKTLQSTKGDVKSAMDDLMYAINHPLELEKDIAKVKADLASKALQKGLASSNPEIKATAEQTQQKLFDIWDQLQPGARDAANAASEAFADNLNNGYPSAKADAADVVKQINAIFNDLKTKYNITVDSSKIGKNDKGHHAAGGHMDAGEPGIVGEQGSELFVPDVSGTVIPHAQTVEMMKQGTGNVEYHYHVNVAGLVRAESPADIGRMLRRMGSLGLTTQPVMTT